MWKFWALIFAVIGIATWSVISESADWEEFKTAHACKVTAKVSGDTFNTYGVGANGQMTIGVGSTPSKTGWTCDDGITYFR